VPSAAYVPSAVYVPCVNHSGALGRWAGGSSVEVKVQNLLLNKLLVIKRFNCLVSHGRSRCTDHHEEARALLAQ